MIKKRVILWWLLFTGIISHMFYTIDISLAIISMVGDPKQNSNDDITGYCYRQTSNLTITIVKNNRSHSVNEDILNWTEKEQNTVLSSFYWLSWVSELFGGILSHKYGSKIVFGLTNFIACVLSSLIPVVAYMSPIAVSVVRLLQGTIGCIGFPAGIATIVGHWSPPDERGRFLAVTFGVSIGFPIFGAIDYYFGWAYVFHFNTIIGIIWYIFWYFFIFDTPDLHPTISKKERQYIKKSLTGTTAREQLPVPWKDICTSIPVFINILCGYGQIWSFMTIGLYMSMYLKNIHNMNTRNIGMITGFTYLIVSGMQMIAGVISDKMISTGLSRTFVRKFDVFIGGIVSGIVLLGIFFTECNVILSVLILVSFVIISSWNISGPAVAQIDMSPNFCDILGGISCALGTLPGFLAPAVLTYLLTNYDTLESWNYFFLIAALLNIIPGTLFVLFSDSELQPWNSPKIKNQEITLTSDH